MTHQKERSDRVRPRPAPRSSLVVCFLGAVVLTVLAAAPSGAASIPAWLDDAVTEWNKANPGRPIEFVDIKDSFVWYRIAQAGDGGSSEVRDRVYGIAQKSGYKKTTGEELVTTARPPSLSGGPATNKKCWSRSFTLDVAVGSQRMLTSLICEDTADWLAGFRVLQ